MRLCFLVVLFTITHSAPTSCPNGTVYDAASDLCYLFAKTKLNFWDAESQCVRNGGHLTTIANAFQNSFLANEAKNSKMDENIWIGLTSELSNETQWEWTDASTVTYTNWRGNNQPKPDGPNHCTDFQHSNGDWHDHHCGEDLEYVCTVAKGGSPTTTTTSTTTTSTITSTTTAPISTGTCEDGWSYFNGHCYWITLENSMIFTYDDDIATCDSRSSTIASIHSDAENQFILELAEATNQVACAVAIGFARNGTGSPFFWLDNTTVDYTNWAPNWPSDGEPNRVVMAMNQDGVRCNSLPDGSWVNGDPETFGVVCKK